MDQDKPKQTDPTLALAIERFALYDTYAKRKQIDFKRMQLWILALGVLVTTLSLTQTQLLQSKFIEPELFFDELLKYIIILLPITISIFISAANRFKEGNKWILLRAGAETIKREIFRYRVYEKFYQDHNSKEFAWKEKLADRISKISDKLQKTELNMTALKPLKKDKLQKHDHLSGLLGPEDYIKARLEDQLEFYNFKTGILERKLKRLYWLIYIIGGFGTLLAAKGLELWVALTITLIGTFTTYLQYQQVENTIMSYNQAATNLSNIKLWWTSLLDEQKKDVKNIQKLVEHTETALQNELSGWVQYMEDALVDLYDPTKQK